MTITVPEVRSSDHGSDKQEDVHIRCMVCRHSPVTSVCGVEMTESDERDDPSEMNCARCAELWSLHVQALHPVSRARRRVRRRL